MKIGFPTHPRRDLVDEIQWIGANGFDFVDLFLEEDRNAAGRIDVPAALHWLDHFGLERVGHTGWYLPIGSPVRSVRQNAVDLIAADLAVFERLGCAKVSVHANWPPGLFSDEEGIAFQTESLQRLAEAAGRRNIQILYESLGSRRDNMGNIREILARNPAIAFHADIGHLHLHGRDPLAFFEEFHPRLGHVHLHDNDGSADQHLPMGVGSIDWDRLIPAVKSVYDGTITLEIFAPERAYVLLSRQLLQQKWQAA